MRCARPWRGRLASGGCSSPPPTRLHVVGGASRSGLGPSMFGVKKPFASMEPTYWRSSSSWRTWHSSSLQVGESRVCSRGRSISTVAVPGDW